MRRKPNIVLSDRQAGFVREYLKDRNASRAYKKVYKCRASVAGPAAGRLLKNVKIQAEINKLLRADVEAADISREKVLRAYANIAFGDMRDLYTWGDTGVRIKASDELTAEQAARLESIQVEQIEDEEGTVLKKIKIVPQSRLTALQALGRHLGIFNDSLKLSGAVGAVNLMTNVPGPDPAPKDL